MRLLPISLYSIFGIYRRMIVIDFMLSRHLPREQGPWTVVLCLDGVLMCDRSMWDPDATKYSVFVGHLGKSMCQPLSKCHRGGTWIEGGSSNARPGPGRSFGVALHGFCGQHTSGSPLVRVSRMACRSMYLVIRTGLVHKT